MATDLFGNPLGGKAAPEFKLNLQQKRQAALLYYWMSLDYLKGLKGLIDALIRGADVNLELAKRQGRDALLTNDRWGVRDTAANWSTHVFPALEDFRQSTIKDIALRATESYEFTGANQCGRMIQEFSSMWMTPEEEEQFKEQWEKVYHYASFIDHAAGIGGNRHHLRDHGMTLDWRDHASLFKRLPKFRVRTDVEAVSGKRPARTGVYVSQEDANGTLQFAWTGNEDGTLGELQTFNDLGIAMLASVGRSKLWLDDIAMQRFAVDAVTRSPDIDTGPYTREEITEEPEMARAAMAFAVFTTRPCKWYFVERVEGEFDDEEPVASAASTAGVERLRCEGGQPCPQAGFWFTPAQDNSRRKFAAGELMPVVKDSHWGTTIWQWDDNQA